MTVTSNGKSLIMVVDDDSDILSLVSYRLELAGYDVVTADDGEQGLSVALDRCPALAVLDVRMPKLNGFDLTRRIREEETIKDMPVILLTASVQDANVAQGFEAGANDYMKKPFSPEELVARVQSILERR